MYILKRKNKSGTIYFLCKSFIDINSGKNTSKIVERLGTEEEVKKRAGDVDIDKWLKQYAKEKEGKTESVSITLNPDGRITPETHRVFNGGYLIFKKILNELKLNDICKEIAKENRYTDDLTKVLYTMIYDKIYYQDYAYTYRIVQDGIIERARLSQTELNAALRILVKNTHRIKSDIFWSAYKLAKYDTSTTFVDCNNFIFNMVQEKQESMEVVQVETYYDKNGIPLTYFNNSTEKDDTNQNRELLDSIAYLKKDWDVINISDKIQSKTTKEIDLPPEKNHNIIELNIRTLKKELQDWIWNDDKWSTVGKRKEEEIDQILYKDRSMKIYYYDIAKPNIYYKTTPIKINNENKTLVAIFSDLKRLKDRDKRYDHYINIKKLVDEKLKTIKNNKNNEINFLYSQIDDILETSTSENNTYKFKNKELNKDIIYDGFDLLILDTNKSKIEPIVKEWSQNNQTKSFYRTMKYELSQVPKKQSKENFINLHLLICYIGQLVLKIITMRNNNKFSEDTLVKMMAIMDFVKISGQGWIPAFVPDKFNTYAGELLGIDFNREIITDEAMKKLIHDINYPTNK